MMVPVVIAAAAEHTFVIPARQNCYRCGACGDTWIRALRSGMAFNGADWQAPAVTDGGVTFFECCGCRFGWRP